MSSVPIELLTFHTDACLVAYPLNRGTVETVKGLKIGDLLGHSLNPHVCLLFAVKLKAS